MRISVFDKLSAGPSRVSLNTVWIGVLSVLVALGAVSANWQIIALRSKLDQIGDRPIAVQAGENSEIVQTDPVDPSENVGEFVKEVLPPMFAWSKRVLPEVDPSGVDPGKDTRYGKLPTLIFYYTNALDIRYRNVFRKNIGNYKPEKFDSSDPESTLMRINRLAKPRKTKEGWEVDVYSELITLDKDDVAYATEPFNATLYLKEILPPKHSAAFTPIEEAFIAVQKRGLLITRISRKES